MTILIQSNGFIPRVIDVLNQDLEKINNIKDVSKRQIISSVVNKTKYKIHNYQFQKDQPYYVISWYDFIRSKPKCTIFESPINGSSFLIDNKIHLGII